MPVETRFFREDQFTVNGLTYRKLLPVFYAYTGGTYQSTTTPPSQGYYWGIRVWKRSAAGVETEITAGTLVAVVSRTAEGEGIQSATWSCPRVTLAPTDSIVVRGYYRFGTGAWYQDSIALFTTEQLGGQSLDASTWTVYYYTALVQVAAAQWEWYWQWGSTTFYSRIENFAWTPAPVVGVPRFIGDGLAGAVVIV
jgi:hypothetical protein